MTPRRVRLRNAWIAGGLAPAAGFTLVEVLVALMVVAIGLSALLVAVSGTARTSGYLRDKMLAQWIALNRLTEVRLNTNKSGINTAGTSADAAEVDFAGRRWHYDTRYFDTSFNSMKRIVVRVYAGDKKTKGNALAESTSFIGTALNPPGSSNSSDWTTGSTVTSTTNPGATAATPTSPATQAAPTVTPAPVTVPQVEPQ